MTRDKAKKKAAAAIKTIMQAAFELHEAQEQLQRAMPKKRNNREGNYARSNG